jgi:hypothetical protein
MILAKRIIPPTKCEGCCHEYDEGHQGEVVEVEVSGHGWKPSTFYYCQTAIKIDKENGFLVRVLSDEEE